jgi:glyoxylase-like metal-dependent hydrolase (beta-lactamase superfamily II)
MPRLAAVKRFVSNTGARIYRIACDVLPGISGRVYLILGAGPATLVDSGSGEGDSTRQILAGLDAVRGEFGERFTPRQIERILVTHAHIDHIGGLSDMVRATGAQIGVHPLDSRVVAAWDERAAIFNRGLRAFFERAGVPAASQPGLIEAFGFTLGRVSGLPIGFFLDEQRPLDGLRIIHTPGHSPGHVCVLVGDVLLCGDHILPRTIPQQWPEWLAPNTGLGHYLHSLAKVGRLGGIRLGLGGHEPPIHAIAHRADEIRAAQMRRLDRILELTGNAAKPLTIAELTKHVYSRQKGFYEVLALTDVASRVEYLELRGRLEIANFDQIGRNGELAYRYRSVPGIADQAAGRAGRGRSTG